MKMSLSPYFLLSVILIFILYSCGNSDTQADTYEGTDRNLDQLKEEVIAIHDEVMPKMGALKHHQKRLSEEITVLQSDEITQEKEEIAYRREIIRQLDQAYEGMFVWMRQFKPHTLEEMDEEEGRAYLLDQKEKVEKVNKDIKSALGSAEEVSLSND